MEHVPWSESDFEDKVGGRLGCRLYYLLFVPFPPPPLSNGTVARNRCRSKLKWSKGLFPSEQILFCLVAPWRGRRLRRPTEVLVYNRGRQGMVFNPPTGSFSIGVSPEDAMDLSLGESLLCLQCVACSTASPNGLCRGMQMTSSRRALR